MNKLEVRFLFLIIFIVFCSIGGAFSLYLRLYELSIFCGCTILYLAYSLFKLNMRTVDQFKIFISSIRFSDYSISFKNTLENKIYQEYYNKLNGSLQKLNLLTQKRESEINFYINLLNRADFGLLVTDRQGDIVWINKTATNMLGHFKSKTITSLRNISENLFDAVINLQPKMSKTVKILKDGNMMNMVINLSIASIRDESYNIYSIKNMQPVIEETENQAWKELVSVLTHEMMNSLSPIISLSETFSDTTARYKSEEIGRAMSIIHRRSKGLVSFVDNYKKIAHIPSPEKEMISVKHLVGDVIELFVTQNVSIKCLITFDNLMINADRSQMEQVLINLIKNALEASIDTPEPNVKISVMQDLGNVIISVSDNGCGISPEISEKIFIPFYTTKINGSGIGLSICRQIVNLHGGTLTVNSVPNEGSVFVIRM